MQTFTSYSGMRRVAPREQHTVRDLEMVADRFQKAAREGRKVTLRAAGRSFDDQAMNGDLVVDVASFDRILSLDPIRKEITVEPGVTWGRIVEATLSVGLMPHIMVTTPTTTAGGTVSANCISRSSTRYGHQGDHVRSLELLTPAGELLRCSREENAELFRAAIGGFGWFGFISQITFELLRIGARRRVRTGIARHAGLTNYLDALAEASLKPGEDDAVYSVFSLRAPQVGAVFRSRYTEEPVGRQLFLHQPAKWYRPFAELLFTSTEIANALAHASYNHVFGRAPFIDDLTGYTFPMWGHERTKALAGRAHLNMRTLQPSFLIPIAAMRTFLDESNKMLRAAGVYPALLDALYVPADDFLLSSGNGLAGMLVTYTFESLTDAKCAATLAFLYEIAAACLDAGGRLHLVKSTYASREQLGRMFAHAVPELVRLKARADPSSILTNDFFTRAFG